jgi:hypothetical protein
VLIEVRLKPPSIPPYPQGPALPLLPGADPSQGRVQKRGARAENVSTPRQPGGEYTKDPPLCTPLSFLPAVLAL